MQDSLTIFKEKHLHRGDMVYRMLNRTHLTTEELPVREGQLNAYYENLLFEFRVQSGKEKLFRWLDVLWLRLLEMTGIKNTLDVPLIRLYRDLFVPQNKTTVLLKGIDQSSKGKLKNSFHFQCMVYSLILSTGKYGFTQKQVNVFSLLLSEVLIGNKQVFILMRDKGWSFITSDDRQCSEKEIRNSVKEVNLIVSLSQLIHQSFGVRLSVENFEADKAIQEVIHVELLKAS